MRKKISTFLSITLSCILIMSCSMKNNNNLDEQEAVNYAKNNLSKYVSVKLTSDISNLSEKEKQLISVLFEVGQIMDDIYWEEAFGNKEAFLKSIKDSSLKKFALINYGPWDFLNNNFKFMSVFMDKPLGANYYPKDMTKEEFEKLVDPNKTSQYTLIRRDDKGKLIVVPYYKAFKTQVKKASDLLKKAAILADDAGLKKYLNLRAEALLTDNYQPSDYAWMDMKQSNIDFVVGPIENYDDQLYGYKTAHEAFILLKDKVWSDKLTKYTVLLPELQKGLPVEEIYKKEIPGTDSDINVYDAIFYGGDCNSGSKTIAINLPNDEQVCLKKGTRKLQLKNAMKAKFDNILVPIAKKLISPDQIKYIKFDAFFANTMFHEVAHALGIKNVINKNMTVRDALKESYATIEESKADIMGLYMVTKLYEKGTITEGEVMDNYVTFLAGIFRSVRFGAASDHGKANMIRFNYFEEKGAFKRNSDGTYSVDFEKMKAAMISSVQEILKMQGDGNYELAKTTIEKQGKVNPNLQKELDMLKNVNIPVDIVFEQGKQVLGLK